MELIKNRYIYICRNDEDRDGVVGWPPIKSWRNNNNNKRVCHDNQGGRRLENAAYGCGGRRSNSMYVKVKMEGVAIGRKVDVSLHHSFQTLTETLLDMFGKCKYIQVQKKLM